MPEVADIGRDGPVEEVTEVEEPAEPEREHAAVAAGAADGLDEPPSPLVWDPERYTTAIGEPDWYAEEEEVGQPAPPALDWPAERGLEEATPEEPQVVAEEPEVAADEPPFAANEPEVVADEPDGSAEMEVAPSAHAMRPEPRANAASDDALAALDALAQSSAQPATGSPPSWSATPERRDGPGAPTIDPARVYRQGLVGRPVPAPTPASRAYRRLRRIFPG
jgi:hypothetical protein